ncbi:MAG: BrnT family toxin [Anaerolineales bacterium]|nr:BrnT family toxin [Anaerolineales bacterium]
MDWLETITGFDWDDGNQDKNWLKHRVSNRECEELFFNLPLIVANDKQHSQLERRFFALGKTNAGRRLFIAFTIRDKLIRVISARDMSRRERETYAKATT